MYSNAYNLIHNPSNFFETVRKTLNFYIYKKKCLRLTYIKYCTSFLNCIRFPAKIMRFMKI